jgi:uncharacterized protein (DUF1800 family)
MSPHALGSTRMSSAPRAVGRRLLVPGALATAAVAGQATAAAAADQDLAAYPPARFKGKDKLLSRQERHLVSRFSYGVTPDLAREVRRAGGAQAWFAEQLRPNRVKDRKAGRLQAWWPSLKRSPADLWKRQNDGIEGGWEVMNDYARWCLMRRMTSRRQLLEVVSEFFENHLHVPALGDAQFTHRVDYGNRIREHALGRFDEMLLATTTHPAMLIYLDAAESTKEHPNENLGRELLELHTVGRDNYDEKDVKSSARILTGWSVDMWESWKAEYHVDDHYRGTVKVKGFKDKNKKGNGKALTARYLRYLAHHPDTAEHLATRLAEKFIGPKVTRKTIKQLAKVYLQNDTAIVPVLEALVASKDFRRSVDDKVRDPGEDVVATYRALRIKVGAPPRDEDDWHGSAIAALVWQTGSVGLVPFEWAPPDGQPIDNESWSSPARLMASMDLHWSLAHGHWPQKAVRFKKPMQWMPGPSVRFDELVDHLSQQLLHRHSDARLLKACRKALDIEPKTYITEEHELIEWKFGRLLACILDSPDHYTR